MLFLGIFDQRLCYISSLVFRCVFVFIFSFDVICRIRRPPILKEEDVQLHISVLLANGAIQVGSGLPPSFGPKVTAFVFGIRIC